MLNRKLQMGACRWRCFPCLNGNMNHVASNPHVHLMSQSSVSDVEVVEDAPPLFLRSAAPLRISVRMRPREHKTSYKQQPQQAWMCKLVCGVEASCLRILHKPKTRIAHLVIDVFSTNGDVCRTRIKQGVCIFFSMASIRRLGNE